MNQLRAYGVFESSGLADPFKFLVFGVYLFGCLIRCVDLEEGSVQYDPKVFQFENFCKEDGNYDLSMVSQNIYKGQVTFKFKETMPGDFKCTVIIGSNGFERDRLAFYFTEFDMGDNCGPDETWLLVGEGDMTVDPKPIQGLLLRMCGRTFFGVGDDKKQFTTEWRHLRLEYHANNPPVGSGFSIVFQHFSDPPCYKWQYLCDNNRCIDEKLKCSGNNPCGDNTDCPQGLGTGSVIGIVVGCAVGLGVAVFLYKCLPSAIKSSNERSQRTETDREMDNILRRPINSEPPSTIPRTEGRDSSTSNDMAPPRYSSLENAENKRRNSADIHRDSSRRYEPDIPEADGGRHDVQPSAPTMSGETENEQDLDSENGQDLDSGENLPPPPSYDAVMSSEGMYSVSGTQPNLV